MKFSGRLAVQQRVLPVYRAPFFDTLAASCEGGMSLFAGEPRPVESIATTRELLQAKYTFAENRHFLSGPLYLCYQQNMLDWLDDWDPDALIVEANPRYLATPAAVKWMRERGRPVIGWGLGAPYQPGPWAGLRQKNWMRFLRRFDALVAYSQSGAADYAALGFPLEKIYVAHNAVARRPTGGMPTRPLRQPHEPLVVLFVGRLQERKRLDNLMRACAALPKERRPKLWIVGDGPARESLEGLAHAVYPRARFFGARHGPELDLLWAEADLFALPGTGGLAVQEAMSHALPVIVAKGDGTQDDLVRKENGWQIPHNDLDALKDTLAFALSDNSRLITMGAESWRIVAEEVNVEKMVDVFIKALKQVS